MDSATGVFVIFLGFILWSGLLWLLAAASKKVFPQLWQWSRLWQLVIALSLLPLLPTLPASVNGIIPETLLQPLTTLSYSALPLYQPSGAQMSSAGLFNAILFVALWLLACISFIKWIQLLRAIRKVSRTTKFCEYRDGANDIQKSLLARLKRQDIRLCVVDLSIPPFIFGFLKPVLVIPKIALTLPHNQINTIIEHELTHFYRHDPISILVINFLTHIFWFNPFLKLMEKRFMITMELDCDAQTLARCQSNNRDYANTLINCLKLLQTDQPKNNHSYATFIGDYMNLKDRITTILHKNQRKTPDLKNKLLAVFSVVSLALFPLTVKSELQHDATTVQAQAGVHPLPGARLSSKFGVKQSVRKNKAHKGIDLAAPAGTPILASFAGTVIVSDDKTLHPNYGKTVVVQHGDNYQTVYSHMESITVSKAQKIAAGTQIGTVGATGRAIGPHLHFEVLHNGEPQDPEFYLDSNF